MHRAAEVNVHQSLNLCLVGSLEYYFVTTYSGYTATGMYVSNAITKHAHHNSHQQTQQNTFRLLR